MAKTAKHHITHFKSIEINGYKSIKHLNVEFLPGLNILIGKNNAGKTNFLDCLNDILFLHQRKKVPFSSASIDIISSNQEIFTWYVQKSEKDKGFGLGRQADADKFYLPEEKILLNGETIYDTTELENSTNKRLNREIILEPLNLLPQQYNTSKPILTYIKFNLPNNLSFLQDPGHIIASKPNGLFEWDLEFSTTLFKYFSFLPLDSLFLPDRKATGDDIKTKLISSLKFAIQKEKISKFSPIQDFRLSKNLNVFKDDEIIRIENLFLEFLVEGTWMPWSNLSDGTKRIFYLLFEVARIDQGVILIDEPELGIHPHQFYQLMLFLKEEAEQKQIILATHAPQTLDFISPEELNRIFIASYDKKLGTQIRPLTEEQKEKAKHYMKNEFLRDYWLASDLEV